MENQIKNEGILRNLIILSNLLEEQVEIFLENLGINFIEFSILGYIAKGSPTQYELSKEYEISLQRMSQIITKLEKYKYISKNEQVRNGKLIKILKIEPAMEKQIDKINDHIIEISNLKVNKENLEVFNKSLKILVKNLRDKEKKGKGEKC
ncbi:MAG: hypothetical protein ACRC54_01965 [Fusobacteriaceae bacterium]